jgi:hypothetical protein
MAADPLSHLRALGLDTLAAAFPDAVADAADAAARLRAAIPRDLPPRAEPATILPPPAPGGLSR